MRHVTKAKVLMYIYERNRSSMDRGGISDIESDIGAYGWRGE